MAAGVTVHLHHFEGPLGLLLYLIRKEEMDIMNINIGQITDQYLTYIRNMGSLDLENAGEFVAMAATLIHIKSKMLLPHYSEDEDEPAEDPRKELVQKLLDYQIYKEASQDLYGRPLLGRDVWIKGAKEPLPEAPDDLIEVDENPLFSMILSYRKVVKRVKKAVHRVAGRMQSVASRILEIKEYLKPGSWMSFFELMDVTRQELQAQKERRTQAEKNGETLAEEYEYIADGPEKTKLLITFLSLLELGKIGFVRLFQSETYGDIHVETLQSVEKDVISQVEEYEVLDTEDSANQLFAKSLAEEQVDMNFEEPNEDLLQETSLQGALDLDDLNDSSKEFNDFDSDTEDLSEQSERSELAFEADKNAALEEGFIEEAATDEEIEDEERKLGLEI